MAEVREMFEPCLRNYRSIVRKNEEAGIFRFEQDTLAAVVEEIRACYFDQIDREYLWDDEPII